MAQPKYLTGDIAAINEFLDRFDVRFCDSYTNARIVTLLTNPRFSCWTAMVQLEPSWLKANVNRVPLY